MDYVIVESSLSGNAKINQLDLINPILWSSGKGQARIGKHKANTTELHPKVRQTCFFCFQFTFLVYSLNSGVSGTKMYLYLPGFGGLVPCLVPPNSIKKVSFAQKYWRNLEHYFFWPTIWNMKISRYAGGLQALYSEMPFYFQWTFHNSTKIKMDILYPHMQQCSDVCHRH